MFKQGDIIENQLGNIFTVEDVGKRFYTVSEYANKSVLSVLTIEYVNEIFKLKSIEENELILEKFDIDNKEEEEFKFLVTKEFKGFLTIEIGKYRNYISKYEAEKLLNLIKKTYIF